MLRSGPYPRCARTAVFLILGLVLASLLVVSVACETLTPDAPSPTGATATAVSTAPETDAMATSTTLAKQSTNTTLGPPPVNTTLGQAPTSSPEFDYIQPGFDFVPVNSWNFYEETAPYMNWAGAWTQKADSKAHGGGFKELPINGSVFMKFQGTGVQLYCMRGPDYGLIRVIVDGQEKAKVDLYSYTLHSWMVWQSAGLSSGQHWLRLEDTHEKNPTSTGDIISFDGVAINGTLIQ